MILCFGWLLFLSGCNKTINQIFPKEPRPFQEREFNSEQWKEGDAQTRGEMAYSLYHSRENESSPNDLMEKPTAEVLKLLGEPDKRTRGNCCYIRHAPEVEVWLYRIQISYSPKDGLKEKAFQIYFNEDGKTVQDWTIDEMEDKPVHIPKIG